ncbi:MAG: V-type ATP synthase subunit A [Candidatus Freyarchaeota archaeon]|nr:V-type ATP synthase subunit A [Candidatus Jordarchaeia archaeon]MBS7268169.1 V-type ATP synthase subunit A [Candidatus Jordarchaeia archaeon]MBS7279925.1 V-type ATP synthase subunit A [Candidatus Jordarchaeia archaeon]
MTVKERTGRIIRIAGPVVEAEGLSGIQMYEVCRVGDEELIGEVNRVEGSNATIQVYEETTGLKPGEKVIATGAPLSVELGPGLIGQIFDGIQRPLHILKEQTGDFIRRGVVAEALPRNKKWKFTPAVEKNDRVTQGTILGTVPETTTVTTRILVPVGINGKITKIAPEGEYTVTEPIARIETTHGEREVTLMTTWPVRQGRPYIRKLGSTTPLITGQRIIDTFFPTAKGGTASIPGGFGTGKTVMLHQLAKWADSQIVVYCGCGERGNEMTEVLEDFPKLEDPRTGEPLMKRTILIANTSNMPVAAREASIYTAITLAEYFRDQGYDVALMADSTSRWAEALREISGRLEEMPGEEGYPAYLASRLAEFYERAGRVETLGSTETNPRLGSVTITGAVSPPGGDFSEPVTSNTLRVVKVFWGLDKDLASRRHFPAINWLNSYSLYIENLKEWFSENVGKDFVDLRNEALSLLQREDELREVVQLVGPDALPESERVVLEAARLIREDYLMQSALHPVDTYCSPEKAYKMLKIILKFYNQMKNAVDRGVPISSIQQMDVLNDISRLKIVPPNEFDKRFNEVNTKIDREFSSLTVESIA